MPTEQEIKQMEPGQRSCQAAAKRKRTVSSFGMLNNETERRKEFEKTKELLLMK